MSERITFTAEEPQLEILDEVEQRVDIDSTAGAVRACITESARLQREVEALQHCRARDREQHEAKLETLEAEIAGLEQQLNACRNQNKVLTDAYQMNQEATALVKRRKDKQDASLVERVKWWWSGRD